MKQEKYGFVYIWFDTKHKRYYVGRHWGTETDGYICSSRWMKISFKRRPNDFKRRIVAKVYSSVQDLIIEEQRWLDMIKQEELGNRYYNRCKWASSQFTAGCKHSAESKKLMSLAKKGKPRSGDPENWKHSEETKKKWSETRKGKKIWPGGRKFSDDHWNKMIANRKGRIPWNKGIKTGITPWNKGNSDSCPQETIDRLKSNKGKTYEEIYGVDKALELKQIQSSKKWYNNGTRTRRFLPGEEPFGWFKGRLLNP